MRKLTLLVAFALGYVLGAKAGQQRYEQIKNAAFRVKEDPRVQSAASTVAETAKEQGPVVAQKVTHAAGVAASAAAAHSPFGSSDDNRDELLDQLDPESTARQEDPYPQGRPALRSALSRAEHARPRRWRRSARPPGR